MMSPNFDLFTGCRCANSERMHPLAHQIAQRGIDGALALHAVEAGEGGALDDQREMAFAAAVVAGVADVRSALVDQFKPGRGERREETLLDIGGDRAGDGGDTVHLFYIEW